MNNNINNNKNTGDNYQQQIINYLNQFLSNIVALTIKMYNYHWNIVGPHFFTLHSKFEEYYKKSTDMFDIIAERIKQLDGFPITTISGFSSNIGLREAESKNYTANEVIRSTIGDFKYIHRMGSDIASYAASIGDGVTSGLIGNFLQYLEKQLWMLEASIK
ncbi:MAG TPA: DNA starvation/stationary phase protection protein [Mollicutes bacterium]|nr:DNA starvation/stationary phase protection protein [Mollicutes bacterium]